MKTAFFDLTGTLLKESSIPQYIKFLASSGFLKAKDLAHLSKIHEEHKKHHLTELQSSQHVMHELAHALRGVSKKKFDVANARFVRQEKIPVYPYSVGLLAELKAKHYQLVVVSGAPEDIVKPIAKVLGMDDAVGTRMEVQNGRFTGRLTLDLTQPHQKRKVVEQYASKRNGVLSQCLCFGDMVLDEEMMSAVGHAVALNAGPALRRAAHQHGWLQVKESQVLNAVGKIA